MENMLRLLRAVLVAVIAFFSAKYLSMGDAAKYVAGAAFVFSLMSFFFRWTAIATIALMAWAAAHILFSVPNPTELVQRQKGTSAQSASVAANGGGLTAKLLDLKEAREKGLLTDAEYQTLRTRVIDAH
jgi:hypothetical protein